MSLLTERSACTDGARSDYFRSDSNPRQPDWSRMERSHCTYRLLSQHRALGTYLPIARETGLKSDLYRMGYRISLRNVLTERSGVERQSERSVSTLDPNLLSVQTGCHPIWTCVLCAFRLLSCHILLHTAWALQ